MLRPTDYNLLSTFTRSERQRWNTISVPILWHFLTDQVKYRTAIKFCFDSDHPFVVYSFNGIELKTRYSWNHSI